MLSESVYFIPPAIAKIGLYVLLPRRLLHTWYSSECHQSKKDGGGGVVIEGMELRRRVMEKCVYTDDAQLRLLKGTCCGGSHSPHTRCCCCRKLPLIFRFRVEGNGAWGGERGIIMATFDEQTMKNYADLVVDRSDFRIKWLEKRRFSPPDIIKPTAQASLKIAKPPWLGHPITTTVINDTFTPFAAAYFATATTTFSPRISLSPFFRHFWVTRHETFKARPPTGRHNIRECLSSENSIPRSLIIYHNAQQLNPVSHFWAV